LWPLTNRKKKKEKKERNGEIEDRIKKQSFTLILLYHTQAEREFA